MESEEKEPAVVTISEPLPAGAAPAPMERTLPPEASPLEACFRSEARSLGRFCMALVGSPSDAEDLLQETLLAAHAAFETYSGAGSLRAWLFGIARRQCARHLTRRTSRAALAERLPEPEPASDQDELMELKQRALRARALLEAVPPSEREALVLRFTCELSFRDVAEACGIDEAAARKRVSRALSRLRGLAQRSEES